MSQLNREAQAQIAKELTLSISERIKSADSSDKSGFNKSLAEELASAYEIIFETVKKVTE